MRPFVPIAAIAALLLSASTAWAVREWYDHYETARQHVASGNHAAALRELKAAVQLKPAPGNEQRTYGLEFVDYYPYYYQGVCYLKTGDFVSAVEMFNIEERYGAIRKKDPYYRDLVRLRSEAEDSEHQRILRRAREEVTRLVKEAEDLAKAKKYDDALARLADASAGASALDPLTQRNVLELRERVRTDQKAASDAQARSKEIDDALNEATAFVEGGQDTEALVRFDQVLKLDPRNSRATEGKRAAQERILASQTRDALRAKLEEGRTLVAQGRHEAAIPPLTEAAADPRNTEAVELLERAQRVVAGLRQQKTLHTQIERLMTEGERLLGVSKYAEAQVQFDAVLALDAQNVRARDRLDLAQRMTVQVFLDRWRPPQPPTVTLTAERVAETRESTLSVAGVATDDRQVANVQIFANDTRIAELRPILDPESPEARNVPFGYQVPLILGANKISVVATDGQGLAGEKSWSVMRQARFYETRAFLPSAAATALGLVGLGFAVQRARRARAVRRRFNPYIAGAPILDERMFFGREKLLARILNVLHHNSLMITGERRIGKTTFLYHLKRALETDDGSDYRFFPVLTDLQGVPETGFFHTVMGDVVDALSLSAATMGSLRFRTDSASYDGRDFSYDVQRVIEELKTRTSKRVKLALLIDEVDVLNEYSERINQRLRSIFMKTFSEHLVAIMSGVGVKRTWKSEGSPWYNFFDEIELTPFTREEAEALIRRPVDGLFQYQPEAVDAILRFSDLKPYLIQKFCIHAINCMLEERRTTVTLEDVESVRETVRRVQDEVEEPAGVMV